jgi:ariadne-1
LPCRHQHCLTCWQSYVELNIVHSGCGQAIYCPSRCIQVIDDEQILIFLSNNKNLRERYQRFLVEAFVETNRLTHWCPGNGCTNIVKMKSYTPNCTQLIECDMCNTKFCFKCLKQWHEPLQCSVLEKWEQKNRDESMTGQWILGSKYRVRFCINIIGILKLWFRYKRMSKMSFKY